MARRNVSCPERTKSGRGTLGEAGSNTQPSGSVVGNRETDFVAQLGPFHKAAEDAIATGDPPGLVALVWRNGEVFDAALGLRLVEEILPMQRDTIFRIASMTKPITSALILMLMEESKLRLDDPIVKWTPELANRRVLKDPAGPIDVTYPSPREITIEDLLTHRSGLAYAFSSTGPIADAYQRMLPNPSALTPDEFLAALGTLPLTYPPGERWLYSHSTDVLGVLAGRIAGKPFRDLLFERIFRPLGMSDTDFWIPPEKHGRAARVYAVDSDTGALVPHPVGSLDAVPKLCGGGGGLVSTADDYLKFARMLLGRGEADGIRILKPETVALMTGDRLTEAQRVTLARDEPHWVGGGFGLGVGIDIDARKRTRYGASSDGAYGWPGAFGTWFRVDPEKKLILLYLVQFFVSPVLENIPRIVTGVGTPLESLQRLTYAAFGR
jgi:CubicO group peptidase (beta-lactamase class C family)